MALQRARARAGLVDGVDLSDEAALRQAWQAHADELFGVACRALGDRSAADEAVQEVFVRAWRSAASYDRGRPLRPWLFAILRHVVVDEARARRTRPVPQEDDTRPVEDPEASRAVDRMLDAALVHEALRRLREDHRVVLVETCYRDRTYADVAAELGIPEGTARSRAFYGLRALRLALEEMGWQG